MATIQQYPINSVTADDTVLGTKVPTTPTEEAITSTFLVQDIVNLTLGSGTLNKVPLWTPSGTKLGDSVIAQSGTDIGVGTTSPGATLEVVGGIKFGDDTSVASASNVGTIRYRQTGVSPTGFTYVDICMYVGGTVYSWKNIITQPLNAG